MSKDFIKLGFLIGLGGTVTFKNSVRPKEVAANVPNNFYVLETDAPYLAPVPVRGTINTPVNVEHVYNFIAEVRGCSPEELSNLVDENIKKLFLLH